MIKHPRKSPGSATQALRHSDWFCLYAHFSPKSPPLLSPPEEVRLSKASPQNIHLIFEGLGLLRQAGQLLVAVQQVGHLALQDFPAHAHVVSAVLQPEEQTQREEEKRKLTHQVFQ